jgi:hypothetical protein
VVVPAPKVLAVHDRQPFGPGLAEDARDLGLVDLLNGQVDESPAAHRLVQVAENQGPVLREDVLHCVDAHRSVEVVLETQFLQANLLEHDLGVPCSGSGQHACRLIDPDHRSAGR